MPRHHHELPFGAEPVPNGVRFRLWAPRAASVSVQLEGAQPTRLPMAREAEGWFALTTAKAAPGTRYRYTVDGKAFPDPASRSQPAGVHGPSEVVDGGSHPWRDLGWQSPPWNKIVLYELHLGTFSETGDCDGAIRHFDHLR
ncbi:MAG: malto-oligosyltrehalose trehalohydrolase, partial [Stellaceae bacterium]